MRSARERSLTGLAILRCDCIGYFYRSLAKSARTSDHRGYAEPKLSPILVALPSDRLWPTVRIGHLRQIRADSERTKPTVSRRWAQHPISGGFQYSVHSILPVARRVIGQSRHGQDWSLVTANSPYDAVFATVSESLSSMFAIKEKSR